MNKIKIFFTEKLSSDDILSSETVMTNVLTYLLLHVSEFEEQ